MAWYLGTPYYPGTISSKKTFTVTLNAGEVANYCLTFAKYGKVYFYTEGDLDTVGFLCESASDIDESTGKPWTFEEDDDDYGDGSNFKFRYNVENNKEYWIYIKLYNASASGTFKFIAEFDDNTGGDDDDGDTTDKPDDSGARLTADVNGTNVTLSVSGLDASYSGRRATDWSVCSVDASGNFVEWLLLNQRVEDDSMDLLWSHTQIILTASDGITPDTRYRALANLLYIKTSSWISGQLVAIEFATGGAGEFEANAKLTTIRSPVGTSISAFVVGLDAAYPYNDRYIVWSIDGDPLPNVPGISA